MHLTRISKEEGDLPPLLHVADTQQNSEESMGGGHS